MRQELKSQVAEGVASAISEFVGKERWLKGWWDLKTSRFQEDYDISDVAGKVEALLSVMR